MRFWNDIQLSSQLASQSVSNGLASNDHRLTLFLLIKIQIYFKNSKKSKNPIYLHATGYMVNMSKIYEYELHFSEMISL